VPRDYPTNLRVTAFETALAKDTVFLCFQLRSADPARFLDPRTGTPILAGAPSAPRMADLNEALAGFSRQKRYCFFPQQAGGFASDLMALLFECTVCWGLVKVEDCPEGPPVFITH